LRIKAEHRQADRRVQRAVGDLDPAHGLGIASDAPPDPKRVEHPARSRGDGHRPAIVRARAHPLGRRGINHRDAERPRRGGPKRAGEREPDEAAAANHDVILLAHHMSHAEMTVRSGGGMA